MGIGSTRPVAWGEFARAAPELAAVGRERLHGREAYLATVKRDGAPRVHPVGPVVSPEHLYVFMEPTSPKGHDLRHDPRFALHCGVEDSTGGAGEFFVTGTAVLTDAKDSRQDAVEANGSPLPDRFILFELIVGTAELREYTGPGSPVTVTRWRSNQSA